MLKSGKAHPVVATLFSDSAERFWRQGRHGPRQYQESIKNDRWEGENRATTFFESMAAFFKKGEGDIGITRYRVTARCRKG
jgi:hypothetical protein